ncbi:hypothetical protein L226DRAFT_375184 [Lentinus tigrinus ALCF2SS1-7]|uniref:Uncharacterized protein n=1 Tax=Lentinus tigrinus ALCF2SS1-6 TaxID=1328759 RepID=A0A5C2SS65_9APHY|nr:hypothetical protein L227DRAFT_320766 [Lentinus tigrinus ALCF2SS1-6]RPD76395.1 hypothetical protein L226DRAFT_375184 [Lentinus tigrinus ALCF2SS1-7]
MRTLVMYSIALVLQLFHLLPNVVFLHRYRSLYSTSFEGVHFPSYNCAAPLCFPIRRTPLYDIVHVLSLVVRSLSLFATRSMNSLLGKCQRTSVATHRP